MLFIYLSEEETGSVITTNSREEKMSLPDFYVLFMLLYMYIYVYLTMGIRRYIFVCVYNVYIFLFHLRFSSSVPESLSIAVKQFRAPL